MSVRPTLTYIQSVSQICRLQLTYTGTHYLLIPVNLFASATTTPANVTLLLELMVYQSKMSQSQDLVPILTVSN